MSRESADRFLVLTHKIRHKRCLENEFDDCFLNHVLLDDVPAVLFQPSSDNQESDTLK